VAGRITRFKKNNLLNMGIRFRPFQNRKKENQVEWRIIRSLCRRRHSL